MKKMWTLKNAAVAVIGVNPLETVPVIVKVVQTRIFPVNMKKITDIFLKLFVAFFFS